MQESEMRMLLWTNDWHSMASLCLMILSTNGMSIVVNVCLLGYVLSVCVPLSLFCLPPPHLSLCTPHLSLRTFTFSLAWQLFYSLLYSQSEKILFAPQHTLKSSVRIATSIFRNIYKFNFMFFPIKPLFK